MRSPLVSFLALGTLLGACATPTPAQLERPFDVARRIVAADNACDLDAVLDCYAEEAVLMPPNEPSVRGRDAIRPRYEQLFATFQPRIESVVESSWSRGDRAAECGTTRGELVPRDGSPAKKLDDKYVMHLRRDPDGRWRIERLIWSPNR
jgi:uncharacterized protein (TIGR02246 family)